MVFQSGRGRPARATEFECTQPGPVMNSTNAAQLPPNRDATRAWRRAARKRRGSIYAVVLGMAILVSLIGLSAVAVGRVNMRVASIGSDGTDAELLSLSAIEHAAATINTDATWRSKYAGGTPIT